MKPATFFAVFIPILGTLITTIVLVIKSDNTPGQKKIGLYGLVCAMGLIILAGLIVIS